MVNYLIIFALFSNLLSLPRKALYSYVVLCFVFHRQENWLLTEVGLLMSVSEFPVKMPISNQQLQNVYI